MVCQDEARLVDNKAGTRAAASEIPVGNIWSSRSSWGSRYTEEVKEIKWISRLVTITSRTFGGVHAGFRIDIDHCRVNLRGDLRKRVGKRYRVGNDQGR